MKTLKITYDEIKKLIEQTYNITNIKFMQNSRGEGDLEIFDCPDWIEGEVKELGGGG